MAKKSDTKNNAKESKHINYFHRAKIMLLASVGKLPTALVVILLISMAMAGVAGMAMQFGVTHKPSHEFMPLRLDISDAQPAVDQRKLQGNWVYQTPEFAMTLTLADDRFDWVVAIGNMPDVQFYARGNYRLVGDVLILGVRPDLGVPVDTSKPWLKYMPIAMIDLNVKIKVDKTRLNWNVPLSEQRKILSQSSLIFSGHDDGNFEWVKQ